MSKTTDNRQGYGPLSIKLRQRLALLICLFASIMAAPAFAQLSLFTPPGIPVGEAEWDRFRQELGSLLNAYQVNEERSWSSSEGRRDWHIRMLDHFQKQGLNCATVETSIRRQDSDRVNVYRNPYCRTSNGQWKLAD